MKRYTEKMKQAVVNAVRDGMSVAEAHKKYGMTTNSITAWLKRAKRESALAVKMDAPKEAPVAVAPTKSAPADPVVDILRKENEYLRALLIRVVAKFAA